MRHQDLTINHRLESWAFANAAARTAAGAYVAGDIGRIGFQNDTAQYWRLISTTPTWALIGPPTPPAYASVQTAQISPSSASAVSPGVMMGLGATITPTATGKILVTIAGTLANGVATKFSNAQIRYGTGTPPVNGAAGTTGTPIGGAAVNYSNVINESAPLSLSAVITGAALGVQLWFDLQLYTSAGGVCVVLAVAVTATELP
jgi:hypothetical protein